jgi:hypothetical protein
MRIQIERLDRLSMAEYRKVLRRTQPYRPTAFRVPANRLAREKAYVVMADPKVLRSRIQIAYSYQVR